MAIGPSGGFLKRIFNKPSFERKKGIATAGAGRTAGPSPEKKKSLFSTIAGRARATVKRGSQQGM